MSVQGTINSNRSTFKSKETPNSQNVNVAVANKSHNKVCLCRCSLFAFRWNKCARLTMCRRFGTIFHRLNLACYSMTKRRQSRLEMNPRKTRLATMATSYAVQVGSAKAVHTRHDNKRVLPISSKPHRHQTKPLALDSVLFWLFRDAGFAVRLSFYFACAAFVQDTRLRDKILRI